MLVALLDAGRAACPAARPTAARCWLATRVRTEPSSVPLLTASSCSLTVATLASASLSSRRRLCCRASRVSTTSSTSGTSPSSKGERVRGGAVEGAGSREGVVAGRRAADPELARELEEVAAGRVAAAVVVVVAVVVAVARVWRGCTAGVTTACSCPRPQVAAGSGAWAPCSESCCVAGALEAVARSVDSRVYPSFTRVAHRLDRRASHRDCGGTVLR